ncbi:MAG TPA: PRC-barrel domain-containing protein [Gammaproteobacteria bacterium]|nr:PRC-barrel domain-containing protein [Gammaproteobacteria bacterium]
MRPIAANVLSTVEVLSPAGENVGKIVDFMLDTERGSVVYAVLAVGGVLGVGAKMLAIPPAQLRFDPARRCLEIGIETAALEAVPGIDRTNAPESAEDALLGRAPTGAPQPAARGQG